MEKSNSQLYFFSPSKHKSSLSPQRLIETQADPIKRLSGFLALKMSKIETLRKEKMICEIRSLQDRPHISENSKKLFKSYVPIYKRLEEVVKSRYEHKKTLQIQAELSKKSEFKANCTFKTCSKTPTRTPEEFVEDAVNWETRRVQLQESLKRKKEEKEELEITLKPSLSSKTLDLTSFRSLTPVFERLCEVKPKDDKKNLNFRPNISPISSKMVGKRQGAIFNRLYSQRKFKLNDSGS